MSMSSNERVRMRCIRGVHFSKKRKSLTYMRALWKVVAFPPSWRRTTTPHPKTHTHTHKRKNKNFTSLDCAKCMCVDAHWYQRTRNKHSKLRTCANRGVLCWLAECNKYDMSRTSSVHARSGYGMLGHSFTKNEKKAHKNTRWKRELSMWRHHELYTFT